MPSFANRSLTGAVCFDGVCQKPSTGSAVPVREWMENQRRKPLAGGVGYVGSGGVEYSAGGFNLDDVVINVGPSTRHTKTAPLPGPGYIVSPVRTTASAGHCPMVMPLLGAAAAC